MNVNNKVVKSLEKYNEIEHILMNGKFRKRKHLIVNITKSSECEEFYNIKYYFIDRNFKGEIQRVPNVEEIDLKQEEIEMFLECYNQVFDIQIGLGKDLFPLENVVSYSTEKGVINFLTTGNIFITNLSSLYNLYMDEQVQSRLK